MRLLDKLHPQATGAFDRGVERLRLEPQEDTVAVGRTVRASEIAVTVARHSWS